jgi:hypothetical protein
MPEITLPIGPVEYLAVAFPGSRFTGQIVPALQEVVANGTVHIIDLAFVTKGEDGTVVALELDDLDAEALDAFDALDGEVGGLLNDEDLVMLAEALDPGSSAAIIVWENSWAARLVGALRAADAEVIAHERIPVSVVEEVVGALADV